MVGHARSWLVLGSALLLATLPLAARVAEAHPLHTTLVQLTYDEKARRIDGSIRVFAGDFATAVAKRNGAPPPIDDRVSDAAAFAYVRRTFALTDAAGEALSLTWCGSRREGDVLWLCIQAAVAQPTTAYRLSDQMLCELFDDQINIVQATRGTRRASMLFTKGDGAKNTI